MDIERSFMINLYSELREVFQEVSPREFYRAIFPLGELDEKNKFTKGKYTGIACEFCGVKKANGKELVKRYSITDDLNELDELLASENFIIMSPISYVGKSRSTANARFMYAFAIEIDELKVNASGIPIGFHDLVYQFETGFLPTPNYIVASGNGLHLYYIFEKPLVLFDNVKKSLKNFKKDFTKRLWNRYVTDLYEEEKIQYESVFQGFRLVGGVTKDKERTRAFRVSDEPISIDKLNEYVFEEENKIEVAYKSDLTLSEAKEKYPDWYEKRIVKKESKGRWVVKRDLYDWWFKQIWNKGGLGHRYHCVMLLCVYAIKCDISQEELEKDCYSLLEHFDSLSKEESNRFTIKDIADALQSFEDKDLVTYPIDIIAKRSGIEIKKNKRNGLKQKEHLEIARAIQSVKDKQKGKSWREGNGRKQKKNIVQDWRKNNPDGKKIECHRETGLSRPTIDKWWEVKEMDRSLSDGELLYYTKKKNIEKLSPNEATEMAIRLMNRVSEIAKEENVTEEEAYNLFLEKGRIADGFGDWLLSNRDKFNK